jgi:hypothetical protein
VIVVEELGEELDELADGTLVEVGVLVGLGVLVELKVLVEIGVLFEDEENGAFC